MREVAIVAAGMTRFGNIDPAIDRKIRDQFPILLPREVMSQSSGRW